MAVEGQPAPVACKPPLQHHQDTDLAVSTSITPDSHVPPTFAATSSKDRTDLDYHADVHFPLVQQALRGRGLQCQRWRKSEVLPWRTCIDGKGDRVPSSGGCLEPRRASTLLSGVPLRCLQQLAHFKAADETAKI